VVLVLRISGQSVSFHDGRATLLVVLSLAPTIHVESACRCAELEFANCDVKIRRRGDNR
jgi:hypothetical protein